MTKQESIRKLKPHTRMLPCKLTDDELREYGQDLAKVRQDILTEEARQVSLKQQLKASLTELEARSLKLSSMIARGEEARDVDVEPQLDFKRGTYCEVRLDTGERIGERAVTAEERQENLLFEKPEPEKPESEKRTAKKPPPADDKKRAGAGVN